MHAGLLGNPARGYEIRLRAFLIAVFIASGIQLVFPWSPLHGKEIEIPADLRTPIDLGRDVSAWRFKQGDSPDYRARDFDDSRWERIKALPHNWRIRPPGDKDRGFGWYRIALRFPAGSDGRELMLRVGPVTGADEFYFNGVLIGATGKMDPAASRPTVPGYDKLRFYPIPANLIRNGERNVIAVRVQTSFVAYAGFTSGNATVTLGHVSVLRNTFHKDNLPSLLMCMVLMTVGAYFLLLFTRRRHTWENFWFGLSSLVFSGYYIMLNQVKYSFTEDLWLVKRIEYMFLFIQIQVFMNFSYAYFSRSGNKGDGIRRGMVLIANAAALVSFLVPVFTSDVDLWHWWNVTISQPLWVFPLGVIFWTLIREAWNGSTDARLMLSAAGIGVVALVNDVLVELEIIPGVVLGNYAFFIVILALAAILANRFVRLHNEVEELNVGLEKRVAERTSELKEAVDSLNEARDETDKIMKTVDEGLLLVYPMDGRYTLGREYSAAVHGIFAELHDGIMADPELERFVFHESGNQRASAAMPERLRELLEKAVGTEGWEAFAEYGRLLFNPAMDDGLVEQVNPLGKVQFDFQDPSTGWTRRKYLRFQFRRIRRDGAIAHVMVQVRDVTAEVELEQKLAEKEEQERSRMRRLTELLRVEPSMLVEFLDDTRAELRVMEEALETFAGADDRKERLNAVFRSLHTIKGNAALLDMETFASRAHAHEEDIARLAALEKPEPDEEELLRKGPREILSMMEEIDELFKRLRDFQDRFETDRGESPAKESLLVRALGETVKAAAREAGKKIALRVEGLETAGVPDGRKKLVKDVLVQLTRNSAAHGIETPETRAKRGKPEQGTIRIQLSRDEPGKLRIDFSDDGGGLDLEALRKRATDTGALTPQAAAAMTDREANALIFLPGLSTAEKLSLSAGRGVGMDVVKSALDGVGGEIEVYSEPGKAAVFKILLPE